MPALETTLKQFMFCSIDFLVLLMTPFRERIVSRDATKNANDKKEFFTLLLPFENRKNKE